ncbi:hypothetical protein [Spiroplasma culicicola]|uniref:Uncharacterized protein n=1 Tax=Spiroplasma culicicola AES-1 TaxID=1276246 RepID=W6A7N0_9MOLU|nr:hypothetical protein [Spiroplasma culicicola]AHI52991.1 hypothetical protein SCULI_v1c06500 [Spiroplasma culicicola AES-1]
MYYVMCKNNDFFVMDKNMNVVAHFATFDEAQRTSLQLNYQAKMQETMNRDNNDLLNINKYRTNNLKDGLSHMLGQGQVSYGNITINIPGSGQTRQSSQVKDDFLEQKQPLIINKTEKRKPIDPVKEPLTRDAVKEVIANDVTSVATDSNSDSFISTGEINNFLQKLEE